MNKVVVGLSILLVCLCVCGTAAWAVFAAPTITSFTPARGGAGVVVTVTGTKFTGATAFKFNGTAATSFTVVSATSITAVVPKTTTGRLSVTTPGGSAASSSVFTFIPAPTISSFTPTSGGAGTMVKITGTNFSNATSVKFNGTAATSFTVVSGTSITAIVPKTATGKISVTTPGGTATTISSFTFIPAPTISSFTPTSGRAGATVTITGTNFIGATAVKWSGIAATGFAVASATSIRAVVPKDATGQISVTTPGGTATSSTSFTFIPAPTISSFTPAFGGAGTRVAISGTSFSGATAVKFNGVAAASFTVVSATSITAVVPANPTTGKISVTTPGGTATTSESFIAAPTITSFTPARGGVGTTVTITGANFSNATAVKFNDVAAASFTVVSSTSITAVAPIATTGSLSVTTPGGSATSSTVFTFIPAPTITSFTPTFGDAGTTVTITGTNFSNATAVKFNDVAATSFTVLSETSITAVVPASPTTGKISVTTDGGTATSSTSFVAGGYAGEMIYIPAGSFLMGNSGAGNDALYSVSQELPRHSVSLSGYFIGKYEVTRGEYRAFMNAGGYTNSSYWSTAGWSWKVSNGLTEPHYWAAVQNWGTGSFTQTDNHPVVGVTYYEAEAFCAWAEGHLPTEAQWEKAARWTGSHTNVYPWGDAWDQEKCNNYYDSNVAGGGYQRSQTAPVGSYPSGASPYGCQDMAGNVWEWCQDWCKSYPGSTSPFDYTNSYRVLRGGGWSYYGYVYYSSRCAFRNYFYAPKLYYNYLGFRLCRSGS